MNDYKELIEKFRAKKNDGWQKDGSYREQIIIVQDILDAADAIEQLVKERDEWKTLGEFANKRAEDYREMRRQRDEAIKERDAAIADLENAKPCTACKHVGVGLEHCKHCVADNCYEWRGVQEGQNNG